MDRVIYFAIALLVPASNAFSKGTQKQEKAYKEAESFGKQQNQKNLKTINSFSPNSLISKSEPSQTFNVEEARRNTLSSVSKAAGESKQEESKSFEALLNMQLDEFASHMDLSAFSADLEGLIAEESSANSEKLPSIIAKLSIFKEIKKELEGTNGADARFVTLFKGDSFKCSRNVLSNVLYDCCDKMAGMATKAHLAKCDADEIALSQMREEGKCHYVGKYDKKAMGMIKKSEREVFCCFPSKLSRIIQEEGRKQLRLTWGKAKKPDCRGLTPDEIKRLDFTKLNLQEAIPQTVNQTDFQNKLSAFQKKIQDAYTESPGD